MARILFLPLTDAWFEILGGECRLRVATDRPNSRLSFTCRIGSALIDFTHVADIKNRRVYEATQWRQADSEAPLPQAELLQLQGPFRGGPQDVS